MINPPLNPALMTQPEIALEDVDQIVKKAEVIHQGTYKKSVRHEPSTIKKAHIETPESPEPVPSSNKKSTKPF